MKKFFLCASLTVSLGLGLAACSNGDYDANPNTNNSGGVNPLNPTGGMTTDFSWGGTDPISMEVNGVAWKADEAAMDVWPFDNNHYLIGGMKYSTGNDTSDITLFLRKDIQPGNTVFVFAGNTENTASFMTSLSDPNQEYASTLAPFGEIKVLENDANHIKGLFYFLARNQQTGQYINIQKGYFNVPKP